MAKLSPVFQDTQFDSSGNLLSGGLIYTYAAGSVTPQTTYTSSSGLTAQANPIVLNARAEVASPIWLTEGLSYKLRLFDSNNNFIREFDNVTGIGDNTVSLDQWISSGVAPTYINATSFTVPGDQTSNFTVGRRVKATVTAGTVYGTIASAVFTALTTVTLSMDGVSVLDAGLSSVQLGLITPDNTSAPVLPDNVFRVSGSADKTKKVALEVDGLTTGTTRTLTVPDKDGVIATVADITAAVIVPRGYLSGLTMSTAGASTTMSVSAGIGMDSTNLVALTLASAISKTTSAWAVGSGNGGIDTGTIAVSTWYYFFLIRRPDTGVVDVIFSLSSSAPTLPTNYTQYRYIGGALTNASSQWTGFTQFGDDFFWSTPPALAFNGAGSPAAALLVCDVPRGRKVKAWLNASQLIPAGTAAGSYFSDPNNADVAPVATVSPLLSIGGTNSNAAQLILNAQVNCWTNTSAQIRHRELTTNTLQIQTLGWTDLRERSL